MKNYRLILAGLIGLAASAVYATPTLSFFDGTTLKTIADGSVDDINANPGEITFNGTLGVWTIAFNTAQTFPGVGSLTAPELDISYSAKSTISSGSKTLTVAFSADGFGPTGMGMIASVGGTAPVGTTSSTTYKTYSSGANTVFLANSSFAGATLVTNSGPLGTSGGSYSSDQSGALSPANFLASPYSLTQLLTITHGSGTNRLETGDAHLHVPDGGTTALLVGVGLLGTGLLARRRRTV